jgi:hypothetical protein
MHPHKVTYIFETLENRLVPPQFMNDHQKWLLMEVCHKDRTSQDLSFAALNRSVLTL